MSDAKTKPDYRPERAIALANAEAQGWKFNPGQKVRLTGDEDWKKSYKSKSFVVIGTFLDAQGRIMARVTENYQDDAGYYDLTASSLVSVIQVKPR